MNVSKKFGFVILHYLSYEMTEKCINRILLLFSHYDIQIVCIDNNSYNDSYNVLVNHFKDIKQITFIKNNSNLGFAQGNNIGYLYLKANYTCNYIIILNNDVLFLDKSTLDIIESIYNRTSFGVLGPDVFNPITKIHQNPSYNYDISKLYGRSIKDVISRNQDFYEHNKNFFLFTLKDKILKFRHKYFHWVRKIIPNKNPPLSDIKLDDLNKEYENVVLHGSCYIFSEIFINKRQLAFNPNTFLYFEEDILHLECMRQNLKMLYSPLIQVEHLEDVSTNIAFKHKYKREKMISENLQNSTNVFIDIYNEFEKMNKYL